MPKVSVLMAVYNTKEQYLREAIESVLAQTFKDFEFILLDDASSDINVKKTIESYSDKRIKYLCNEVNLGIADTRNKLIDLANGEYLAVMDHDDVSLPMRLQKEVDYLDKYPEVGVVSTFIKDIPSGKIAALFENDEDIKIQLMHSCAVIHSACMIRKSVLIDSMIRYENAFSPAEDYALWCRLIPVTKFHNIPEILFNYRVHAANTSKIQNRKMQKSTAAIHDFVHRDNPIIYGQFKSLMTQETDVKLFGVLPIIKKVQKNNKTKWLLFGRIVLLSAKDRVKV